jgi:hypothetical protein
LSACAGSSALLHFFGAAGTPSLGTLAAVADHMIVLAEDCPLDRLFLTTLETEFRILGHNQFLIVPPSRRVAYNYNPNLHHRNGPCKRSCRAAKYSTP